uniref:Uncharacterized protein n=1 Tax=Ganoderma boninense TaxID=34458 RepID=A0A5K1K8H3_9APHY|nr:Uncharacterized protein [Ganoderma boninense]
MQHCPYKISRTPTLGCHSRYDIARGFHAPRFEPLLQQFLTLESPSLAQRPPLQIVPALYPTFKQFSIILTSRRGKYDTDRMDRIRASPSHRWQDAHYNTVLVRTNMSHVGNVTLHDCRVARVRVIFSLPPYLQNFRAPPNESETHLAYVKGFTPFLPDPEQTSELYRVS